MNILFAFFKVVVASFANDLTFFYHKYTDNVDQRQVNTNCFSLFSIYN